jgi:hypothetical protein
MTKMSRSPERNTFQRDCFLKERAREGRTPENDPVVQSMVDFYDNLNTVQIQFESDPDWAKYNLEYDLRSTDWILEKVRASDVYAQNLYAAMCNNEFQRLDVYPILANQVWSCSWRYAGGIIADMRESGDYIDWYCSGMGDGDGFVSECQVTDEIADDLNRLGWRVIETNE